MRNSPTIALLGGSFNPPHAGHVHISNLALEYLGLQSVWWLVAMQNPLKTDTALPPFDTRYDHAKTLTAPYPRLHVSDAEAVLKTRYSIHTVRAIQKQFPTHRFVWIGGADIMMDITSWYSWQDFFNTIPIVFFARGTETVNFDTLPCCQDPTIAAARTDAKNAAALVDKKPPAWVFLDTPRHALSSTQLRTGQLRTGQLRTEQLRTGTTSAAAKPPTESTP